MKNAISKFLIIVFALLALTGCKNNSTTEKENIIMRNYCTEIGRFDLVFYEDEISGSYALLPKKSLGAIWGELEDLKMDGRWVDADGTGDIIITFNEDFSYFSTSYRSDDEPEKWYTDSWNGYIRPNQNPAFWIEENKYQCE